MGNNLFKSYSKDNVGKITFYIFEFAALAIWAAYFIFAIVDIARGADFFWFLQELIQGFFTGLVVFGLGRIIDVLCAKNQKNETKQPAEKKEENQTEEQKD